MLTSLWTYAPHQRSSHTVRIFAGNCQKSWHNLYTDQLCTGLQPWSPPMVTTTCAPEDVGESVVLHLVSVPLAGFSSLACADAIVRIRMTPCKECSQLVEHRHKVRRYTNYIDWYGSCCLKAR